jgi:hypothetical protein
LVSQYHHAETDSSQGVNQNLKKPQCGIVWGGWTAITADFHANSRCVCGGPQGVKKSPFEIAKEDFQESFPAAWRRHVRIREAILEERR